MDDFGDVGLIQLKARLPLALFALLPSTAASSASSDLSIAEIEAHANPAGLFVLLQKEAESASALRSEARVLENCLFFEGPDDKAQWLKLFAPEMVFKKPQTITSRVLADVGYSRCATLLKDRDIVALHAETMRRAANAGDLMAKLAQRQLETPTEQTIAAFETELKTALNSKNPDAIWEAGRALFMAGFQWQHVSDLEWGKAKNGQDVDGLRALFQAASCELGYPCGPQSWTVRSACIRGSCVNSYLEWLETFLSPQQMLAIRTELPRVVVALKAGRGERLIWK